MSTDTSLRGRIGRQFDRFRLLDVGDLLRSVTVEPVIFLLAAGLEMTVIGMSTGLYWKICEIYTAGSGVDCRHIKSFSYQGDNHINSTRANGLSLEDKVQSKAAEWTMLIYLATVIPMVFAQPIYGAVGDLYGRKVNILVGLIGLIFVSLLYVVELTYVALPLFWFPVVKIFTSLTGLTGSVYASCYGYMADRTPDKDVLTHKFMILQVANDVAKILMSFISAKLFQHYSFPSVFLGSIVLFTLSFLYALFFTVQKSPLETRKSRQDQYDKQTINGKTKQIRVKWLEPLKTFQNCFNPKLNSSKSGGKIVETVDTVRRPRESVQQKVWQLLTSCWSCFKRKRQGRLRAYLYVTVFAFLFVYIAVLGSTNVQHLFQQRTPIAWDAPQVANYKGFVECLNLFGTIVTVTVLKHLHFHETSILLISVGSTGLKLFLTGFARSDAMMYVAGVFGMAGSLAMPISKSLVTQLVDPDEVGKVYVLFSFAIDGALIISQTALMPLYKATLKVHNGFVLFTVAAGLLVAFVALLWVHIDYKRYRHQLAIENEVGKIALSESNTENVVVPVDIPSS